MTTFLDALKVGVNHTRTENGAVTNKSALDPVVDFFALGGALRNRPQEAVRLFNAAYAEDPQTALRTLFYLRDIRGGQGERDVFRACLQSYAGEASDSFKANLAQVPEYGRWDDLFFNGITEPVVEIIKAQLEIDLKALKDAKASVSLMAKWLPSINASSPATKDRAKKLAKALGMSNVQYRTTLSRLRRRIRLLEHDMSAKRWDQIDYGKLPSQAHRKHTKAFKRHTPDRYQAYLDSVEKGEAKINVSTVYPYEILRRVMDFTRYTIQVQDDQYAEVAWANLPDYTNGNNALVMADVSASMTWENDALAMSVAVSLAMYFAERNTGAFKGHFMTFSSEPSLVKITGKKLSSRAKQVTSAPIGGSTDLLRALRVILAAALKSEEQAPKVLYIISDMEFDQATGNANKDTIFQTAKAEFAAAGMELPHVVFWNVNARNTQMPATIHDGAVTLVSGCSPTVFGMAVEGKTPRELVDSVVNAERYQGIVA